MEGKDYREEIISLLESADLRVLKLVLIHLRALLGFHNM